ncbi:MAG: hypothetical protein HC905_09075 [Bacteroidales bacterium]|nr:hypothetical protein [Bacteroidales bacterium]
MKYLVIIILVTAPIFPGLIKAQEKADTIKHPLHVNFQYAGNVGLASVGLGTSFKNEKIYLGLIYGYLPKSLNDAEVHTIALKTYFRFFSRELLTGYIHRHTLVPTLIMALQKILT